MPQNSYLNPNVSGPQYTTHAPTGLQGIWQVEDRKTQRRAQEGALTLQELEVAKGQRAAKEYEDNEMIRRQTRRNTSQTLNNQYEISKPVHEKALSDAQFLNSPEWRAMEQGGKMSEAKTHATTQRMTQFIARNQEKATYFEPAVDQISAYLKAQQDPLSDPAAITQGRASAIHALQTAFAQIIEIDPSKKDKYVEMMKDPDAAMKKVAQDFPLWQKQMQTAKQRWDAMTMASIETKKFNRKAQLDQKIQELKNKGGVDAALAGKDVAEIIKMQIAQGIDVGPEARNILFEQKYIDLMEVMSETLVMSYVAEKGGEQLQLQLQEMYPGYDIPMPTMDGYINYHVMQQMQQSFQEGNIAGRQIARPRGGGASEELPPQQQQAPSGGGEAPQRMSSGQIKLKDGTILEQNGVNEYGVPTYGPSGVENTVIPTQK